MTVRLPFIRLIGIVCFLPLVAPGAGAARNAPAWTDTGPAFSAGTLGNSGQNLYVNRRGELETIRRYDLDANGYLDLLFNSSHDSYHYVPATVVTAGPGPTLHTAEFGSGHGCKLAPPVGELTAKIVLGARAPPGLFHVNSFSLSPASQRRILGTSTGPESPHQSSPCHHASPAPLPIAKTRA